MKKLKDILLLMVLLGISFMIAELSHAQPKMSMEGIPSDTPADVKEEIERLFMSCPIERAHGARNLAKMGKKAAPAVPFMINMLGDNAGVAEASLGGVTSPGIEASDALAGIGEPSIDPLIAILKDKLSEDRREAAMTLGKLKDPRTVDPLIAALKDEDEYVQRAAAWALVKIGEPAVDPLIAVLKCKHAGARREAAESLGKLKDPRAVDPLIAALKDEDSNVRSGAAESLGKLKDPRVVDPLIAALEDKRANVRRFATWSLGELKDRRAVEPLLKALEDKDNDVRYKAAKALGKTTGQDLGEDAEKWREWWEENK